MQAQPVEWIAPFAVLAAGLILGVVLVLRARRRIDHDLVSTEIDLVDAERQFDARIVQLRELPPTAPARERLELEIRAAESLRNLEELRVNAVKAATNQKIPNEAAAAAPRSSSPLHPAYWFVGGVTVASVVYVLLTVFTAPRPAGGSVTGGNMPGAPAASPEGDSELMQLRQLVATRPEDLELRNDLSKALLARQDWMATYNETKHVLDRQPDNARALAYQSLVRLAMGDSATAESMLKRSLAKDPNLLDGWIHLSLVYFEQGRRDDALQALREARSRHPQEAAALQQLEQEILRAQQPVAAAAAAAPSAPSAGGTRVEIDLDPAARQSLRLPALLFVSLRPGGVTSGPPTAVKRLQVTSFPVSVEISAADSMTGAALPAVARIEARVDLDGNAMSREAGAPAGAVDQVKSGASVKLQLGVR